MRNLIDMLIWLLISRQRLLYTSKLGSWVARQRKDSLSVEVYPEPKTVDTAVNAVWKGNSLMTPIGGGVEIQPLTALSSQNLLKDEDNVVRKIHERTSVTGLQANQWWWD